MSSLGALNALSGAGRFVLLGQLECDFGVGLEGHGDMLNFAMY